MTRPAIQNVEAAAFVHILPGVVWIAVVGLRSKTKRQHKQGKKSDRDHLGIGVALILAVV